jgi:hypothetical protein
MALKVNEQSAAVQHMAREWGMTEALMGGTLAMRNAGVQLMPKFPAEEQDAYDTRLKVATLFPAFKRTIGVMGGKPFSKKLTLQDDVPAPIKELLETNVDLHNTNFHSWAADAFGHTLAHGIAGCLVDWPVTSGAPRTVAEEKAVGARPYLTFIKHNQVLGWKAVAYNGSMRLTQLRLMESVETDDGDFGTIHVPQVRVLDAPELPGAFCTWRTFQERESTSGGKQWIEVNKGVLTIDEIPYVPFYGDRESEYMCGRSPLIDLAYLNVKHWQSQSDQDTILHVMRVPILVIIGADSDSSVVIGASQASKLPADADMKYVEHTGKAVEAGEISLTSLQEQMIETGAELLVRQPGKRTATESANDAEGNKSELQMIAERFEDSLDQILYFMAKWMKLETGGHVELFKDFASWALTDASTQLITSWQQGGLITKATAIRELQRRGQLSADIDPTEELDAVDEEGPPLSMMPPGPADTLTGGDTQPGSA